MTRKPAVTLCIAIWGTAYIDRWLTVVAPSWLSPGNLPAMLLAADLEILVLTRSWEQQAILADPIGRRLVEEFGASFIAIDDLVTGEMSAVTLTLAMVRGARRAQMRGSGAAAAFLNADFILAEGSLGTLARALADGYDIVLAPTLRADRTAIEAHLPGAGAVETGVPSAALAALALKHLHPTAAASFVDQDELTSTGPYEFLCHDGPDLVISRSMQLFPLAVRLGAGPLMADAYCDYGLFDLWVPAARKKTLSDSADWFALELGDRNQQAEFIRPGPHRVEAIAAAVGQWTIESQRAQLEALITIRTSPAAGVPSQAAISRLDGFLTGLKDRLPPCLPLRGHPYWVTGYRRWRDSADAAGLPQAAEAAPIASQGRGLPWRERIRALLYGPARDKWLWQLDARLERDLRGLKTATAGAGTGVHDDSSWLARRAGWGPAPSREPRERLVLCQHARSPVQLPPLDAEVKHVDLVLIGATLGMAKDAAAAALTGWTIERIAEAGSSDDEARRKDLESLGRHLWMRDWFACAGLLPIILLSAFGAAVAVGRRGGDRKGGCQAIWVSASRD